jgi:hypothetical protein
MNGAQFLHGSAGASGGAGLLCYLLLYPERLTKDLLLKRYPESIRFDQAASETECQQAR